MPRSEKTKRDNKKKCEEAKRLEREEFWKKVDEMLLYQSPGTEIASALNISAACLYDRCKFQKGLHWIVYSQMGNDKGKNLLRAAQFQKAIDEKSCTMQIHLGKNWLNQTDRQVIQTEEVVTQKKILELPDDGNM